MSTSANREMIMWTAKALGPLCERVAFLGGYSTFSSTQAGSERLSKN